MAWVVCGVASSQRCQLRDRVCSRGQRHVCAGHRVGRRSAVERPCVHSAVQASAWTFGGTEEGTGTEPSAVSIPPWLVNRLGELGITEPTEIQKEALPALLQTTDADFIVQAETGSGKTLSYLLPVISRLQFSRAAVQAMVVVPSQELGMQVYKVARRLLSAVPGEDLGETGEEASSRRGLLVLPMMDQADAKRQALQLKIVAPRLIVGTPKRLLGHVEGRKLRLETLRTVVVDEFDAIFGNSKITSTLHRLLTHPGLGVARGSNGDGVSAQERKHQTIFVSATVPQRHHFVKHCVQEKWTRPALSIINTSARDSVIPNRIDHKYIVSAPSKKLAALRILLQRETPSSAIVFVHRTRDIEAIVASLNNAFASTNHAGDTTLPTVTGFSDDTPVKVRRQRMEEFRRSDATILISSDTISSRGIDVPHVTHVINMDLPDDTTSYLHRAGRTGRLGRAGVVVSVCESKELFMLERISNGLGVDIHKLRLS